MENSSCVSSSPPRYFSSNSSSPSAAISTSSFLSFSKPSAEPERMLITPFNFLPSTCGTTTGNAFALKVSLICVTILKKSVPSISSLFTKKALGLFSFARNSHCFFVCISIPLAALITIKPFSPARIPLRTSPKKSAYPGVSIKLTLTPLCSKGTKDKLILIFLSFSSG